MGKVQVHFLAEHLQREMPRRPIAGGSKGHTGITPRRRRQILRAAEGLPRAGEQHRGRSINVHDRRKVIDRVIGQARIDCGIAGMGAGGEENRIAIGRGSRDHFRGNHLAGARAILNDNGLSP